MSVMDKKTYFAPEVEDLAISVAAVVCTSPTTYETTLENWTEEEIN